MKPRDKISGCWEHLSLVSYFKDGAWGPVSPGMAGVAGEYRV